jgi:hypothetical protein
MIKDLWEFAKEEVWKGLQIGAVAVLVAAGFFVYHMLTKGA